MQMLVPAGRPRVRRAGRPLAVGTLVAGLAMVLAVAIARFWLGLPGEHVKHLARFFLISGGGSLLVAAGAATLLVHERHGEAGLGLAIARAVVEAHGGQIWAESAPGRGTAIRFTVSVPGAREVSQGMEDQSSE